MNQAAELAMFAGVMALGQFSPGPDMLLLTRTSLLEGGRSGVKMALGIATGLSLHAAFAIWGVAALLRQTSWLRDGLRWVAVAYLGWLGLGMLREALARLHPSLKAEVVAEDGRRGAFIRGLMCNVLNPKVMVFLAAVTAPFLVGERPGWWAGAIWTTIVVEGMVLWVLWALLLQWHPVKSGYRKAAPWIDLLFGLVLLGLAVKLAVG